MAQALWDHFMFITNEQREAVLSWETTEEAMAQLDIMYTLTMARLREYGFDDQGQNPEQPNLLPAMYRKRPFPTQQKKENFNRFPRQYYRLADEARMEEYGVSRKNGDTGAYAKKLAQFMDSGEYWVDFYDELEEWEADNWSFQRGKGKETTTTKPASKKSKREENDDGEQMQDVEDENMEK